ncbi:MAG: universal stress protein [Bacteroidia bacterium]|nr:universal stress protein [Bacteroidia bacterium]NND10958.1 universal stress protein [Flavobacteriaceae bacterium]NNK26794.1 universal stress protein [Flavobacteriaceae bacterium]
MKKIIVPIDFSQHSEYALKTAARMAKKANSEIIVLHMLEISQAVLTTTDSEQSSKAVFFLKLAEQRFDEFLDKDYLDGVKITPLVKHFKVFSEVNDVAKEQGADLIIMGSHGSSGFREVFVGSNTEKVVRHSDIPVLVVKNAPQETGYEKVVFACDLSKDSINPYKKAKEMFERLGTKMQVLYVNLPSISFRSSTEIEQKAKDFFNLADGNLDGMEYVNFISDYSVEKGVLNFSNKIGADLISVPTHGRKGLAHFFEGSITEDIANHSKLPVMTFKI